MRRHAFSFELKPGALYLEFNKVTSFKASAKTERGGEASHLEKEFESKDNLAKLCTTLHC
jgi:hypothetical protein